MSYQDVFDDIDKKNISGLLQKDNGELPLMSIAKLHGADPMQPMDPKIYRDMFAKKMWTCTACYANFAEVSRFKRVLDDLVLLSEPDIYPGYVRCVASLTDEAKKFAKFKASCKKLWQIKSSEDIYLSVLSYTLAKNCDARQLIKTLFDKNADVAKHMKGKYTSRDFIKYDMNAEEFYYYKMAFSLCVESKTDPSMKKQIRTIIKNIMPGVNNYVIGMGSYLKEDSFADAFFGPFLFLFMDIFRNRGDLNLILRLILSIYELIEYYGYPVHDTEPMFIASLFLAINSSGGEIASTGANIILSKCKDAVKSACSIRTENDFIAFLDLTAFFISSDDNNGYVDRGATDVIGWLKGLPKKRIKSIVEDFIVSKLILLSSDIEGQKSLTDLSSTVMLSVEHAFKTAYVNWFNAFSNTLIGTKHEEDDVFVEDTLTIFFNLFIDQARFELHLSEIQELTNPEDDTVVNQNDDNIYRQKYIELETECNELRRKEFNIKALRSENAELKKQLAELRLQTMQHTDEKEKNKKELVGLRNLVYEMSENLDKGFEQDKSINLDEIGEYLNKNVRGIIIGGHVNVHNKLDKYIPKWKKYAPDAKITLDALKNNDVVVIFSDYLSHRSYFGVIDWIRESDCKLLYIHNVNMEYVLNKIYQTCKEEQPS